MTAVRPGREEWRGRQSEEGAGAVGGLRGEGVELGGADPFVAEAAEVIFARRVEDDEHGAEEADFSACQIRGSRG
ncbi:MAG: hypothetical protein OXG65_11915 [Chloroflexi bacterium]|nr:hypothetical protein [Chloroflexota bacterium]